MNEGSMTQPAKNPELNRVQEESEIALKELAEIVAHLTSRLSKVMSPPQAEVDKKPQEPKYYSKLAQDIDSHNVGVRDITCALKMVLDRLEI